MLGWLFLVVGSLSYFLLPIFAPCNQNSHDIPKNKNHRCENSIIWNRGKASSSSEPSIFLVFPKPKKSRPFVGGDFSYAVVLSKFPEGSTGSGATSRASLWRWGSRNGGGFNKNLWAFFFSEGQDAQEIQNASRCTKIIGSAIAELLRNDH